MEIVVPAGVVVVGSLDCVDMPLDDVGIRRWRRHYSWNGMLAVVVVVVVDVEHDDIAAAAAAAVDTAVVAAAGDEHVDGLP